MADKKTTQKKDDDEKKSVTNIKQSGRNIVSQGSIVIVGARSMNDARDSMLDMAKNGRYYSNGGRS